MRRAAAAVAALAASAAAAAPVEPVNWRYDEDWSVLREPANRSGAWWEAAKYRPIGELGYLSLGIEARARHEGFASNRLAGGDAPDDGYLWLRLMPHADLHAGPARLFVQGIAGYARGVEPEPGPADRTGIDLLQGFADLRLPLGAGGSAILRGGRALVALGSERLVGIRYGPNIPQAFDGVRAVVDVGRLQLSLLGMRPVAVGRGNFDDETSDLRRLRGLYATQAIGRASGVDVYLLRYRNKAAQFDQGGGLEQRTTYGVRVFGASGEVAWNWEAMLQRGRFAGAPIRAWSVATETSRRWPDAPLKPTARFRANIASGDKDRAGPALQTFNPMFPKGKYFGELSPIGPYNIINVHPSVDLDLGRGFGLGLAGVAYWRQSRGDGVYSVPGQLIASGEGTGARFIGKQAELVLEWQATDTLSLSASYSLFDPGAFIRQRGQTRTIHMIGSEMMFRF